MRNRLSFTFMAFIISLIVISCTHLASDNDRVISDSNFFTQSQTQELEKLIEQKEFIYLGENHEAMTDRKSTEEVLELVTKITNKSSLNCLFIEVPSF